MIFAVRSDVIELCKDEDGSSVEGYSYYVIAEDDNGRRWAHHRNYVNATKHFDTEEGMWFARRDNGEAEQAAEHLCLKITAAAERGVEIDLVSHWVEIDPAYGSSAYQALDAVNYFRDREIVEARDRGEIGSAEGRLMGGYFE